MGKERQGRAEQMNIGEGHTRKIRLIKVREGERRILERVRDRKVAKAVRSGQAWKLRAR